MAWGLITSHASSLCPAESAWRQWFQQELVLAEGSEGKKRGQRVHGLLSLLEMWGQLSGSKWVGLQLRINVLQIAGVF